MDARLTRFFARLQKRRENPYALRAELEEAEDKALIERREELNALKAELNAVIAERVSPQNL